MTQQAQPNLPADATSLEILRHRAESLAQESDEGASDDLVGVLLFTLGDETYGVPITDVREIYQEYDVTPIPCVPKHIFGVINIRGEIVSVTGLAELMNLSSSTDLEGEPQAIVVRNDSCVTAMVVDEIGDIVELPKEAIEAPVSMIGKAQVEFVSGSVYVEGRLVGLINTDRVLVVVGGTD